MSYPLTQLGGRTFNHNPSGDAERRYDRLRQQARSEMDQRHDLSQQSQAAYHHGDGAHAKELSEQAKSHAHEADRFNKQASEFIFLENNAQGRVAGDAIDLHGQYVEEGIEILTTRINAERQRGATHLHVIVGRGNHSANHIQKLKPAVETLCQQMGLAYQTEINEGRIYIDLTGNQNMPQHPPQPGQGYHRPDYQGGHQPQAGAGYQRPPQQQQGEEADVVKSCLKCCVVM